MFQSVKRMLFISKYNFSHWNTGDGVKLHLWLQKKSWPANEFVDIFMRCHLNFKHTTDAKSFELYMCDQYSWVHDKDHEALKNLIEKLESPKFRGVDKDGLEKWLIQNNK